MPKTDTLEKPGGRRLVTPTPALGCPWHVVGPDHHALWPLLTGQRWG